MKKGCDHHVFRYLESCAPGFSHYQGCNTQKVCHIRDVRSLAPLDVDVTCVVHCTRKFCCQVELFCPHFIHVLILPSCSFRSVTTTRIGTSFSIRWPHCKRE